MFTGIIEATGSVAALAEHGDSASLTIGDVPFAADLELGESVAINGVCLTVTAVDAATVRFDLLAETLRATNLGSLAQGTPVNLERALPASGRLSGHLVQGHVDTTAEVRAYEADGDDHRLEIAIPPGTGRYLCPKGSIAVDGISLTVAALDDTAGTFTVWIIPHTHQVTNLHALAPAKRVNLEFDIVAKYVERLVAPRES